MVKSNRNLFQTVVSVLKHLLGLAKRKVVINDLLRAPLHYWSAWVLGLVSSPVFRHDSRLSIRRGFTFAELDEFLRLGGIHHYSLKPYFFYRFLLCINNNSGSEESRA